MWKMRKRWRADEEEEWVREMEEEERVKKRGGSERGEE